MSPRKPDSPRRLAIVAIGILLGATLAGAALASTVVEGSAHVYAIDRAAQTVVLDGTTFRFDVSTRFYDAGGNRTTSAALRSPKSWNGIPGTMVDPMGVKYEAVERSGPPLLTRVEILPVGID